jgi:hypothetical protein
VLHDPRMIGDQRTELKWGAIGLDIFGARGAAMAAAAAQDSTRQPLHYLLLALPIAVVHSIVTRTNNKVEAAEARIRFKPRLLSIQKFFVLLGLWYSMPLAPRGQKRPEAARSGSTGKNT